MTDPFIRKDVSQASVDLKPVPKGSVARASASSFTTLLRLLLIMMTVALGVGFFVMQSLRNRIPSASATDMRLTVEPATWSGPVGSRVSFVVIRRDGPTPQIVTSEAVVVVTNPKVLSVIPFENTGKTLCPGKTDLIFQVGDLTAKATIHVDPRTPPTRLIVQPDQMELGVGTTGQLKVIAEYEGGNQADLTDDAEWQSDSEGLFVYKGRVEVNQAESGVIRARYRSHENLESLESTTKITVKDQKYIALTMTVVPGMLHVGQAGRVYAVVTSDSGSEFSVDESKDLMLEAVPAGRVRVNGSEMIPISEGSLTLTARFLNLTASVETTVGPAVPRFRRLDVFPKSIDLKVGERSQLVVNSSQPASVQLKSTEPQIVEVSSDGFVIGRQPGTAEVEVTDSSGSMRVPATVTAVEWKSLLLEPPHVSLRTGEIAAVKVFGIPGGANRIELAGDLVNWVRLPRPSLVDFDRSSLKLTGIRPTGDYPERLTARLNTLEAASEITVVVPPMILTLSPDSIEIPLGQCRRLHVQARSNGGATVDVPIDQIEWLTSESGFAIHGNLIRAAREGAVMKLSAKYHGALSNEISVASVAARPLQLSVTPTPSLPKVNDTGVVTVAAADSSGPVLLNDQDLRFASSDPDVLTIDEFSGAFRAFSAGTATIRVSHIAAKEPKEITIEIAPQTKVEGEVAFDANSTIIVEPASGRLAVGERSRLRAFVISPDGSRAVVEALYISSAVEVAATSRDLIQGMTPGEVTVEAIVPGINHPGKAAFVVEPVEFEGIAFEPTELKLVVGQRKPFKVLGVTPHGKVELGDDSNLKIELNASDGTKLGLLTSSRQLQALRPGQASVNATWKELKATLPATIQFDFIDGLMIQPSSNTVPQGTVVNCQVFALRTGRLQPLTREDGVDFRVADPVVAEAEGDSFQVTALQSGKTLMTARFGSFRAEVSLTVIPRSVPVAPAAKPVCLRFLTSILRMDLTDEGVPIRAVQVMPDGTEQQVDGDLELTLHDRHEVVEIEESAAGFVIRPKKWGRAQIDASLGDIRVRTPMIVEVGPSIPRDQELEVHPSTFHLRVGESKRFASAAVYPASGGDPVLIPFSLTMKPNPFITVGPDGSIKGQAVGNAVVMVTPNDPEGRFSGIFTMASIEVGDLRQGVTSGASTDIIIRRELILSGPTETNVGADVPLRVESLINGDSYDVTNQARLVLVAGDEKLAEAKPGGRILAKAPGRIHVQACLGELISAPLEIDVRPFAKFKRLELQMSRRPLIVGEQRCYQLWGYPVDEGPRQDLSTIAMTRNWNSSVPIMHFSQTDANKETDAAEFRFGSIIGRNAGFFELQAHLPGIVQSKRIGLKVTAVTSPAERIEVRPNQLELRSGEESPPIKVLVASQGDPMFRGIDPIQVEMTSSDVEILKPLESGGFTAIKPGRTNITVRYQGLESTIPVAVKINPFASIEIEGTNPDQSSSTVDLKVTASSWQEDLEYRITLPNSHRTTNQQISWVKAVPEGTKSIVKLTSPKLPRLKCRDFLSAIIEARNVKTGELEKYPYRCRVSHQVNQR